jgi:RNA polymerase sigma factor (sigma-70 family)
MEEQALIEKCQSGDAKAFEPLFHAHLQMAVKTAYLIVRDWSIAEDAAQEAFVRAFESIRAFRLGRPFAPWLYRIVVNEAKRLAAKRSRLATTAQDSVEVLVADTETPEATVSRRERRDMLWRAILALNDDHRVVIVLKYFNHFSEAEIATVLGLPQSRVKSRLYTARQRLAASLGDWKEVVL